MRLPEYKLNTEVTVGYGAHSPTLPVGAFVCPIDPYWLPVHIKTAKEYLFFNPKHNVYCYTRYGIVMLDKKAIDKVV